MIEVSKAGNRIESMADWFDYAPPKGGARQWEDGRSAKELARAWCEPLGKPSPPDEFMTLLRSHPLFRRLQLLSATPEARVRFDGYPGERRNADLNILGEIGSEPVVVSVEAKADESFGPTVQGALQAAKKRQAKHLPTNAAARIRDLAEALFSPPVARSGAYVQLPYQLLTAVGATLALARTRHARTALLIIHEFVGGRRANGNPATKVSKVARNAAALDGFLSVLGGSSVAVEVGGILGPYSVPGNSYIPRDVALYVGKARRDLTKPGT